MSCVNVKHSRLGCFVLHAYLVLKDPIYLLLLCFMPQITEVWTRLYCVTTGIRILNRLSSTEMIWNRCLMVLLLWSSLDQKFERDIMLPDGSCGKKLPNSKEIYQVRRSNYAQISTGRRHVNYIWRKTTKKLSRGNNVLVKHALRFFILFSKNN